MVRAPWAGADVLLFVHGAGPCSQAYSCVRSPALCTSPPCPASESSSHLGLHDPPLRGPHGTRTTQWPGTQPASPLGLNSVFPILLKAVPCDHAPKLDTWTALCNSALSPSSL